MTVQETDLSAATATGLCQVALPIEEDFQVETFSSTYYGFPHRESAKQFVGEMRRLYLLHPRLAESMASIVATHCGGEYIYQYDDEADRRYANTPCIHIDLPPAVEKLILELSWGPTVEEDNRPRTTVEDLKVELDDLRIDYALLEAKLGHHLLKTHASKETRWGRLRQSIWNLIGRLLPV